VRGDRARLHPCRVFAGRSFDDRGVQLQGNVGREDELMVVGLEAGGAMMKKRCLHPARRQARGWRACLVGTATEDVVERPRLAQPRGLGVVGVHVLAAAVQQPDGRAAADQLAGVVADLALVAETSGAR
jgi:hypothetical protein